MNILNKLTFRSKMLFFTLLNVSFIWIIAFMSINYITPKILKKQFCDEANTISKTTSMTINEYILTQDYDSLSTLINNLLKNEDIIYTVVTDRDKNILYSNFYNQFPVDLFNFINTIPDDTSKSYIIKTEKGMAYHVSQPLLDGRIGNLHLGFSFKTIEKAIKKLNLYILIAGIVMLFLGSIFSITYSIYLSNPFKKLIIAANEVKKGNLEIKLKCKGNDEIATLTSGFNMMIDGIKENIHMLEKAYRRTGTEEKITAVRELVRGIAEEINSPLTGIKHLTEIIRNSDKINFEKYNEYIRNIEDGLERINRVIQKLIKYTSEFTDSIQELRLNDLINNACKIALEGKSDINYRTIFTDSRTIISGNGAYLTYAFVNLIQNLINSGFKALDISAHEMGKDITLEIVGVGSTINHKAKVNYNDATLALNISCRIIEMHGGTIQIQSYADTKKFLINLPAGVKIQ